MKKDRKIMVFVGTRPEAIKLAPVVRALELSPDLAPIVVSTGQHKEMLSQVVELFGMPIHESLQVMTPGQTLAGLSARLIEGCDAVLQKHAPDLAIVQGDTTTVLAASLACFYRRVPVGHVEAGLRTGDLTAPFPEEANRVICTRLTDLHFAPTERAAAMLRHEHVPAERTFVTGNTVIDALQMEVARQDQPGVQASLKAQMHALLGAQFFDKPFVLITGHRRENFGTGFSNICKAISELADSFPSVRFLYPVHLNPNVQEPVRSTLGTHDNVVLTEPQPYDRFVFLLRACRLVLTDSGGVQEEAPGLGKPVLVMRNETERPEGVQAGTVRLVGTDTETIVREVSLLLEDAAAYTAMAEAVNPYGDGHASGRILEAIRNFLRERAPKN
jgi:UDP-N-acetylglucosamine 2-epimerase (non-hydrolysing)